MPLTVALDPIHEYTNLSLTQNVALDPFYVNTCSAHGSNSGSISALGKYLLCL